MKYYVAFDIGGTKNRIALISNTFQIVELVSEPSADTSPKLLLSQSRRMLDELLLKKGVGRKSIMAIGVSFGGGMDNMGRLIQAPNQNFPDKANIPKLFAKALGRNVFVLHDMKAAALGELHFGQGVGHKDFICLTLSTGVGSGIVIDGKLYTGANNLAGEVGSMVINFNEKADYGPRRFGNFELYSSGTALETMYRRTTGKRKAAYEIQQLAEKGERAACEVFDKSAITLGYGLVSLINIFDPELVIAYGTHFVNGWPLLIPKAKKIIREHALSNPPIKRTKLGTKAALLGVAKWAEQRSK